MIFPGDFIITHCSLPITHHEQDFIVINLDTDICNLLEKRKFL